MPDYDLTALRRQRLRNILQAVLLLGSMAGLLGVAAWLLLGPPGLVWILLLGVLTGLAGAASPRDWILQLYGAEPLRRRAAPGLHGLVEALADRAGLTAVPELYYVASPMLNAFAVGPGSAPRLALTDGLLRGLSGRQLAGVLAHEISHIRSNDLWIMTLSDTVSRLTHALAYAGLVSLVLVVPMTMRGGIAPLLVAAGLVALPTVVTLLQLALSRSREYDADLEAAQLTGDPVALARALQVLEHQQGPIWERIMVPHGRGPDPLLLRTHPPTEQRVERLLALTPAPEQRRVGGPARVALPDHPPVRTPTRLRPPGIWW